MNERSEVFACNLAVPMHDDLTSAPVLTGNYDPETQLWAGETSVFGRTFEDITVQTLKFYNTFLCVRRAPCGCCIGFVLVPDPKYVPDTIREYD